MVAVYIHTVFMLLVALLQVVLWVLSAVSSHTVFMLLAALLQVIAAYIHTVFC